MTALPEKLDDNQLRIKIEDAHINDNLSTLNDMEKGCYVKMLCAKYGLDILSNPIQFIKFQGKVKIYYGKSCADQIRDRRKISLEIIDEKIKDDFCTVRVRASDANGRVDESVAVLPIMPDKMAFDKIKKSNQAKKIKWPTFVIPSDEEIEYQVKLDKANLIMKTHTKAKRRATFSFVGMGFMDESEVETLRGVEKLKDLTPANKLIQVVKNIPASEFAASGQIKKFEQLRLSGKITADTIEKWLTKDNVADFSELSPDRAQQWLDYFSKAA